MTVGSHVFFFKGGILFCSSPHFAYNPAAFGLSCVWSDLITRNDFHLIKDYNYLIKTFSFDWLDDAAAVYIDTVI